MATERAEFTFTAKEGDNGKAPWIMAEGELPHLDGFIRFDLVPGTTLEDAHAIAHYMRQHLWA